MTKCLIPEKLVKLCKRFEPENQILVAIRDLGGTAHTQQIADKLNLHPNDIIAKLDILDSISCIYQKHGYINYGATSFWFITEKGLKRAGIYSTIMKQGEQCKK